MTSNSIDVVENGAIVKVFLLEAALPSNAGDDILNAAGGFWGSYGKPPPHSPRVYLYDYGCSFVLLFHCLVAAAMCISFRQRDNYDIHHPAVCCRRHAHVTYTQTSVKVRSPVVVFRVYFSFLKTRYS